MPRMISFALTTAQVRARTKTVTRRAGWLKLKRGDILQAVERAQGLKRGEHVTKLCLIRVRSVRREPLNAVTKREVEREGFPGMTPSQFVAMFCGSHKDFWPSTKVTRIEFEYL
jgi:hypothetical protein